MVDSTFWTRDPAVQRAVRDAESGARPFPPGSGGTTDEERLFLIFPGKARAAILSAYRCRRARQDGLGQQAIAHEEAMHARLREFQQALAKYITDTP